MAELYAYCTKIWEYSRCDFGPGPWWAYPIGVGALIVMVSAICIAVGRWRDRR